MKRYLLLGSFILSLLMITGYTNAQSSISMNEIYSRGVTGNLDWIEIYNSSLSPVDISGYKIYDSGGKSGSKPKKEFLSGTVIPAQGFAVIVTDTASFDGDQSAFGLSSGGETVWLEDASSTLIDSVVFTAMDVTQSYGRYPDGSSNIQLLNTITRGTSNNLIKMNEIYSRGVTGNLDWIEIYNTSESDIDISGYKIYDSGGKSGSKPKKEFPSGTLIPAQGFYVVVTDTADFEGDASGFGLSSGGETVWLEDINGTLIDTVVFSAMDVTQSYGRYPDGSPNWQLSNTITRGTPNMVTAVEDENFIVSEYNLAQNYPNPFNPSTTIYYTIPKNSFVQLKVFDLLGQEIASLVNEDKPTGNYKVNFDASTLPSGVYIYKLQASSFVESKKMILLK
jgi:predicted extracellular nuclease